MSNYEDNYEKSDEEKLQDISDLSEGLRNKSDGKYFSIKEAFMEVKDADGVAETTVAGGKLVGKTAFNIGKFATVEMLPRMLDELVKKHPANKK